MPTSASSSSSGRGQPLLFPSRVIKVGDEAHVTVRVIQRRLNGAGCGPVGESRRQKRSIADQSKSDVRRVFITDLFGLRPAEQMGVNTFFSSRKEKLCQCSKKDHQVQT